MSRQLSVETLPDRLNAYSFTRPWYTTDLTFSLVGPAVRIRTEAVAAFRAWEAVSDLRFREVADHGPDGGVADDYPNAGFANIRIHVNAITSGGSGRAHLPPFHEGDPNGLPGDIFLNVASEHTKTILQNTMTHEIGHALGLLHSDDPASILYDAPVSNTLKPLSPDDIAGIRDLYDGTLQPFDDLTQANGHDRTPQPPPSPIVVTDPFPGFNGTTSSAQADLNHDQVVDTIFTANVLHGHTKVFDGRTGQAIASFFAFGGFLGSLTVAALDDTFAVGANGAGGHVKVFDLEGEKESFLAFPGYQGNVTVDFVPEGVKVVAGNHVKVYDGGQEVQSYLT